MQPVLHRLSETEFEATFVPPMQDVTDSAQQLVEIWPYAEAAMAQDFPGAHTCNWNTEYVYEDAHRNWQHILINTEMANAYLVVVVEVASKSIIGHHFLNLNRKYGLTQ
jgi:hypothetical protein